MTLDSRSFYRALVPSETTSDLTLRERNKLAAQRHVQDVAVGLFREHGYAAVTVEAIARAAGVGAATVYRYFGSKEGIVSWNESIQRLQHGGLDFTGSEPPARVLRRTFVETIPDGYRETRDLDRVKALYDVPEIFGISAVNDHRSTVALIETLNEQCPQLEPIAATTLAYTAVAALDAALYQWQLHDGARPLGQLVADAFDAIEQQWSDAS